LNIATGGSSGSEIIMGFFGGGAAHPVIINKISKIVFTDFTPA
jgi:hypothetical protein